LLKNKQKRANEDTIKKGTKIRKEMKKGEKRANNDRPILKEKDACL